MAMPSLFSQLLRNSSILSTSTTITATTSHGENYKRKTLRRVGQVRKARVSAQGNLSAKSEGSYLLTGLWQAVQTLPIQL